MWRRIEVRNYRSIEHVKVDLAPFTVVVGPNGSGKSNFADALVFARDIATDASTAVQNRGGIDGVRRWRPSKPTDVSIDLRLARSQEGLETDYARYGLTLASKRDGEWRFKRELIEGCQSGRAFFSLERKSDKFTLEGKSLVPEVDRLLRDISGTTSVMLFARQFFHLPLLSLGLHRDVRRFRLNPEVMKQPQLATERTLLDESGSNIAVAVRSLREHPEKWEPVRLAMRKIVPGLRDIEDGALGRYLGVRFFQEQAEGGEAEFAATEMSEGAIRALGILVASAQMTRDELLIIEEPEASIHPGAAALLFDVLKRASKQGAVLLTTHSAELLDAAGDEEILVCDYRQGVTEIGPLAEEQRKLVKDGLLSVAELMRSEPLRIEGSPPAVVPPEEAR